MNDELGLICPDCGCRHFETTHTIRQPNRIYRRKRCRHCGRVVPSYEYLAGEGPVRQKRNASLDYYPAQEPE